MNVFEVSFPGDINSRHYMYVILWRLLHFTLTFSIIQLKNINFNIQSVSATANRNLFSRQTVDTEVIETFERKMS